MAKVNIFHGRLYSINNLSKLSMKNCVKQNSQNKLGVSLSSSVCILFSFFGCFLFLMAQQGLFLCFFIAFLFFAQEFLQLIDGQTCKKPGNDSVYSQNKGIGALLILLFYRMDLSSFVGGVWVQSSGLNRG